MSTLGEIHGSKTGENQLTELNKTEPKPTLKQLNRRNRTIELRLKGLTHAQIAKKMREEHWRTSQHTVCDDLHSVTAEEYAEELKQQQLADITLANDDYKTRLEYRARMIELLTPRKIQANIDSTNTIILKGYDFTEKKPDANRS